MQFYLLIKEVIQVERDFGLDSQVVQFRIQIQQFCGEDVVILVWLEGLKKELLVFEKREVDVKEKVVVKEVVKVEKNLEMVKVVQVLRLQMEEDVVWRKQVEEVVVKLQVCIEDLEWVISLVEFKVIVKEVKKVEQDLGFFQEFFRLRSFFEEERIKNVMLVRELSDLYSKYSVVEKQRFKVQFQECVYEIFQVDLEIEQEIIWFKVKLQEMVGKRSGVEKEVEKLLFDLEVLWVQKFMVEYKEVIQEVVRYERSFEVLCEIDCLKVQFNEFVNSYGCFQEQFICLQGECDEWRCEWVKVEIKMVSKEVVCYEKDLVLEKEVEWFCQEVWEVVQKRWVVEDVVYELQSKCLLLERRKFEEKVVVQEVVVIQKDLKLCEEYSWLSGSLDEEVGWWCQLEFEVQQLWVGVEEQEGLFSFQEDCSKKLVVERELWQLILRIQEFEKWFFMVQEKIIMEEVVKLEKDLDLEKFMEVLWWDLDQEKIQVIELNWECKNLQVQIDVFQKVKLQEKIIYKEVIWVQKDCVLEDEWVCVWEMFNRECMVWQVWEEEVWCLWECIDWVEMLGRIWFWEEFELQRVWDQVDQECGWLQQELWVLERQKQQQILQLQEELKLFSQKMESE